MDTASYFAQILAELQTTLAGVSAGQVDQVVEAIVAAKRIFVAGAGRSGLAVKGFAMRLMHLGFQVHVAGEVTAPSMSDEDLLIIGSASGASSTIVVIAGQARRVGARVVLVSIRPDSPVGRLADLYLTIPASISTVNDLGQSPSIQPLGTLFEQSMGLTLDTVILILMARLDITAAAMSARHANLE